MEKKNLSQLIFLLGSLLFFLQGDNYASAPVLVDLAEEFNLSPGSAVLTVTSYMVPFGIFTLLFGPLGDRLGKATLLKFSALLTGGFSLLSALMPSFELICLVRILNGTFAAGVMPVSMALIGETAGNDESILQSSLAKAMGLMFLGGAVGPAIGGWLSHVGSWRLVYGFYGSVELLLATILFFKLPSQPSPRRNLRFLSTYRQAIVQPALYTTLPIIFCIGVSIMGLFPFLGNYIEAVSTLSLSSIGLVLTLFGIGALFGGRLAETLRKKTGPFHFPLAGVIATTSLVLILTRPHAAIIGLSLAGLGFSFMIVHPLLIARAQQAFPNGRGTVMSLASLNMALGGGIGTYFMGQLHQFNGFGAIIKTSIGFFLIASVLAWLTTLNLRGTLQRSLSGSTEP